MRFMPMLILLTIGLAAMWQTTVIAQLSIDPMEVYANQDNEKGQQGKKDGADSADCD